MEWINKAVKTIVGLLGLCISYVFPKKDSICIYGAWKGQRFADNPKYLFLESEKRKKLRNIWITKKLEVEQALRQQGFEVYSANSLKGIFYQLRAGKAVLCVGMNDVNASLLGGKKILQLWHGVPLKKIMYDAYTPNWLERIKNKFIKETYVVCTSNNFKKIYQSAFGKDEKHVLVMGQPRNDLFYDSQLVDLEMKKKLEDLTNGRKMILYMPTHRSAGKVPMKLEQHLDLNWMNEFCRRTNSVFVVNKHFYHKGEERIEGYEYICEITDMGFDSQFLLLCANCLITDYSSCYIDYLLRECPIIFYQYDLEHYKQNERELYFEGAGVLPGPVVKNHMDLQTVLESLANDDNAGINEQIFAAKNFFYDKAAQEPVAAKILDIWEKL